MDVQSEQILDSIIYQEVKNHKESKQNWTKFVRESGRTWGAAELATMMKRHDEDNGCFIYSFGVYKSMAELVLGETKEL